MSVKSILFIINPIAGNWSKRALPSKIEKYLSPKGIKFDLWYSEYAGHSIELAKKAARSAYELIVAVGGDGTINEVVNGMIGQDKILGIIPSGSGNGLANNLGLPKSIRKMLAIFTDGHIEKIDLGKVNDRYFISNVATGYGTAVAEQVARNNVRGIYTYFIAVIKYVFTFKSIDLNYIIEGENIRRKSFFTVVSNTNQLGYNVGVTPDADPRNGHLDVCILNDFNWFLTVWYSFLIMVGWVKKIPAVEMYRTKKISIKKPKGVENFQFDGDIAKWEKDLQIEICPNFQKIVLP